MSGCFCHLNGYEVKDAAARAANERNAEEIRIERERINAMQSIPEGGTTADAALNDIKIGYDGRSYETPGAAVRDQVRDLHKKTDNINSMITTGRNLCNPDTVTPGLYISGLNGVTYGSEGYKVTDYIPVTPGKAYTSSSNVHMAWYDENRNYISGVDGEIEDSAKTAPAGAAFGRWSFYSNDAEMCVHEGGVYQYSKFYNEFLHKDPKLANIPLFVTGRNLCNPDTVTPGLYISGLNGVTYGNEGYKVTDYIPVTPGKAYTSSSNVHMAWYDENRNYISGVDGEIEDSAKTAPAGAAFGRWSFYSNDAEMCVHEGEVYQYSKYFNDVKHPKSDCNVEVFLPGEIYCAVGRTIELYNEQVISCGNMNDVHVQWVCSAGKPLKRKFQFTGIHAGSSTPLTLNLYDNDLNLIKSASTIIRTVKNTVPEADILCMGTSITNGKPWLGEIRNLSGNKLNLVGTRGSSPLKHEGRSGWRTEGFLTAQAYEYEGEGVQPFWNASSGRFDYSYYKNTTGVNPDAIIIELGSNELITDPSTFVQNMKQIVDYIRMDDSTINIFVVLQHYWSDQNGLGIQTSVDGFQALAGYFDADVKKRIFKNCEALYNQLRTYQNVHFIPLYATFDRKYNYGTVETPVNPRSTYTEPMPIDSVHPITEGYYQMADSIYSTICAAI